MPANYPNIHLRPCLPQIVLQLSTQSKTSRMQTTLTHGLASLSPTFKEAAKCSKDRLCSACGLAEDQCELL